MTGHSEERCAADRHDAREPMFFHAHLHVNRRLTTHEGDADCETEPRVLSKSHGTVSRAAGRETNHQQAADVRSCKTGLGRNRSRRGNDSVKQSWSPWGSMHPIRAMSLTS